MLNTVAVAHTAVIRRSSNIISVLSFSAAETPAADYWIRGVT